MSQTRDAALRANRFIPTGGELFSKRPEVHLPQGWPSHFSRAQGCHVWDLDDRRYVDAGLMGVGTNILGYAHSHVDEAAISAIRRGTMSTLNAPEEIDLAEELVLLHPWASKVRFTRSGGEACAVAVRLARAATGKDVVAFCGYHGWHDWYLAANLSGDNELAPHLLEGLTPLGVPKALAGTARPFTYDDISSLERALADGKVGTVIMEVQRLRRPSPDFLPSVKELCKRYGVVLIFDECTSGFRTRVSGIHMDFGVTPDVAVFGKTLGNGYPIAAVVGVEPVMDLANHTFISSTFWTERVGPSAAVQALKCMKAEDAPRRINELGLKIRAAWERLSASAGIAIEILGIPALSSFVVKSHDPLAAKTFITQSLLDQGFLSGTSFYASTAHSDEVVGQYLEALEGVFTRLASFDDEALKTALPHGPSQAGFARLA